MLNDLSVASLLTSSASALINVEERQYLVRDPHSSCRTLVRIQGSVIVTVVVRLSCSAGHLVVVVAEQSPNDRKHHEAPLPARFAMVSPWLFHASTDILQRKSPYEQYSSNLNVFVCISITRRMRECRYWALLICRSGVTSLADKRASLGYAISTIRNTLID